METSSKEIRTKIKKIKGELSEAKIYYSRQLSPLKQKRVMAEANAIYGCKFNYAPKAKR